MTKEVLVHNVLSRRFETSWTDPLRSASVLYDETSAVIDAQQTLWLSSMRYLGSAQFRRTTGTTLTKQRTHLALQHLATFLFLLHAKVMDS